LPALSKAFAIAIPHEQAMDVKEEVAFFQAVKARLVKFDSTGLGRSDEEIETTIRQVIDQALVSEQVIDVFDAAGIKKPDISILSEEFLLELKGMEHKNIALEVLKKLLNDELKSGSRKNLVKSKSYHLFRNQGLINDLANGGFYLFIASPKSCGIKLDQTSFYRLKKGDFLFNIHRLFMRYGNGKGFR
jgi:type I site-specific restriction-modification system R (restriction) subunit